MYLSHNRPHRIQMYIVLRNITTIKTFFCIRFLFSANFLTNHRHYEALCNLLTLCYCKKACEKWHEIALALFPFQANNFDVKL